MRPWMVIGLVAALGLTGWMASQDEGAVATPARHDRSARPAASAASSRETKSSRMNAKIDPVQAQAVIDGVKQWQARAPMAPLLASAPGPWDSQLPPPPPPPPPAAVVEAPPAAPMAPPFPHAWVGRFDDEPSTVNSSAPSVQRAVVVGGQTVWVVRVGDVIEGQWRVDQIQDRTMGLTYLPLQQRQSVAMK